MNASNSIDIALVSNEGYLIFNGTTTAPVLANLYGVFSGDASMLYLVNSGTIQPGNDASLFSMTGDYQQTQYENLQIQIVPDGTCDYIQVGGNIFLDGMLTISPEAGPYSTGSKFTLFSSTGNVTGNFSQVICDDPSLQYVVNYYLQAVEIEIL